MSALYEEALVEAAALRKIALDGAQQRIIDDLTPRLSALIENRLLEDAVEKSVEKSAEKPIRARKRDEDGRDDDILLDVVKSPEVAGVTAGEPAGMTLPDEEGKVTLDLDSFVVPDDDSVESLDDDKSAPVVRSSEIGDENVRLSKESADALSKLVGARAGRDAVRHARVRLRELEARVKKAGTDCGGLREALEILREVRHIYFGVRDATGEDGDCDGLNEKLESLHGRLIETIERMRGGSNEDVEYEMEEADLMDDEVNEARRKKGKERSKKKKDDLDEADLQLSVSGLPDEVDPDDVSVSVEPGEDADESGDDLSDEPSDEEPGDEPDAEFGEEPGAGSSDGSSADEHDLSDDDVVEVSERMLKREVARARRAALLDEDGPGGAPGPDEWDDFGGAKKVAEVFTDWDDDDLNKNESVRRSRPHSVLRERLAVRVGARFRRENAALRSRLFDANLFNAKLVYANRLLQRENLSDRQKAKIVESLDSAQSIREVRLLYRTLTESLAKPAVATVPKGGVVGSSSRSTKPSGVVTESAKRAPGGDESRVDRWATLAGIK